MVILLHLEPHQAGGFVGVVYCVSFQHPNTSSTFPIRARSTVTMKRTMILHCLPDSIEHFPRLRVPKLHLIFLPIHGSSQPKVSAPAT